MIKRIIFDLDNTLIIWKEEYISALIKVMEKYKVDYDSKIIDNIISNQEYLHERLTKEYLLNDINTKCDLNLPMEFVDDLLKEQGKLVVKNDCELIDTISYLSTKYELVVLTNWFKDTQVDRLKEASIYHYFKEVYGGDEEFIKPRKEAFLKAAYPYSVDECLMIGDSISQDIKGSIDIGMKAILVDYKNIYNDNEYKTIKKISELKEML